MSEVEHDTPISISATSLVGPEPDGASTPRPVFLWVNSNPRMENTQRAPHPIALLPDEQRFDRVRRRLFQRTEIDVGAEVVASVERKIQWCESKNEARLPYAPVLPQKTKSAKGPRFKRQYWRSILLSKSVTWIVDRPTMRIISVLRPPGYAHLRP